MKGQNNQKITAIIDGKRYTRAVHWMYVKWANCAEAPEKYPFITINGEEYLVFRHNGKPCSVYSWTKYLDLEGIAQNEYHFGRKRAL